MTLAEQQHILKIGLCENQDIDLAVQLCIGQKWLDGIDIMLAMYCVSKLKFEQFLQCVEAFPERMLDWQVMYDSGSYPATFIIDANDFIKYEFHTYELHSSTCYIRRFNGGQLKLKIDMYVGTYETMAILAEKMIEPRK